MYVFTLKIFPRFEGIFGMLKTFRLPINGGCEGMCKGIHNF
jgi:hypothetical protein